MSIDAGERRDYPTNIGERKGHTKKQIAVKAVKVGAALAVAGVGTAWVAKGVHDNQQEYAARLDYNVANQLNEQRQEVHHTKYFKERRQDDGYLRDDNGAYVYSDGKRVEVYNRIVPKDSAELNFRTEPSQSSDRIEEFQPVIEHDGSILSVPVYGDPFVTADGKGNSAVLLDFGDKKSDMAGYYQEVTGTVNGKKARGYVVEDSSLPIVKSIKHPTRNQGVLKVDLTK